MTKRSKRNAVLFCVSHAGRPQSHGCDIVVRGVAASVRPVPRPCLLHSRANCGGRS